jgi:FtsP/CotA-like multicopper oxidase with cupredoxin domain
MYIVQDDLELNLPLPKGEYDVPILIQDKQFSANGALIFDDEGQKSQFGDIITVNGVAWPVMQVEKRKYRFRILNGSVSRSYTLSLSNGAPLVMIGTDAGLKSAPTPVNNFRIGMAERYECVIDFAQFPVGTQIVLQNSSNKNNEDYANTNKVMRFDVVAAKGVDNSSILQPCEQLRQFQHLKQCGHGNLGMSVVMDCG